MGSDTTYAPLYTSAPILDYDEESDTRPAEYEEMFDTAGAMTLAPESFDARILEALVSP